MRYRSGLSLAIALLMLSGCSRFAIDNSSLEYQQARTLAPLKLPADQQTRPFVPIYPTPPVQPSVDGGPIVSNAKGNRFIMPAPKPLDLSAIKQQQAVDTGKPAAPDLVIDGNGYPVLKLEGNAERIWDLLNKAIDNSQIKTIDRNYTLARVDITVQDKPLMLRLSRNGNATTVTVQDAKDALADKAIATDLLNQIIQHWPS
jgi:uncharacterized lipoprotein